MLVFSPKAWKSKSRIGNQSNWGCWVDKKRIWDDRNKPWRKKLVVVKEHIGTLHSWVCAFTIHSQDAQNVLIHYIIYSLLVVACKCILGPIPKAWRFTQRIIYPNGRFRIFLWVWVLFWLSYGSYWSLKLKLKIIIFKNKIHK